MLPGLASPVIGALALGLALSACTHLAASPVRSSSCTPPKIPVAGACVDEEDARAYCGKAARPEGGGCAPRNCPTGEPIDLGSGECVPRLQLRKLATAHKVAVKDETSLGCGKEGAELSVEGPNFACLPRASQCGRGAHWSEDGCQPDAACAPGKVADGHGGCVVVFRDAQGEKQLDVGMWLRLVVGPDGGEGTATVCAPLVRRPWIADVVPHANAILDVDVSLVFPDNDVSQARVTVRARRRFDPHSADPPTLLAVTEHLEPLWKALRGLGGLASAASASLEVHCAVSGGTDAAAVPSAGKDTPSDAGPPLESGKPPS